MRGIWDHGRVRLEDSRRARRTKEEIRQLLLDAGHSLLMEDGLGIGAGGITFKRAFERVEATTGTRLTNASVIRRVWENQAEFQTDVLAAAVSSNVSADEMTAVVDMLAPRLATLDRSTPEARMRSLEEVCRLSGRVSLEAILHSPTWSLWVGIWVLGTTSPATPLNDRVRRALLDGYELDTGGWQSVYAGLADHLGLRLRVPFTMRQFTVSVGALVEGCALRHFGAEDLDAIERPTGPDGALESWNLLGVGLQALAVQYFEIDPDWTGPYGSD